MLAKTVSGHFSSVKIIAAAVVGRFCLQSEDGSWLSGDDVVVCMDCVISLIAYCSSCPPPAISFIACSTAAAAELPLLPAYVRFLLRLPSVIFGYYHSIYFISAPAG